MRRIIGAMITDLTETTAQRIAASGVRSIDEVRAAGNLASFSDEMRQNMVDLKKYLYEHLYRQYQVMRMSRKAVHMIDELFKVFMDDPRLLPPDYQIKKNAEPQAQARKIADYIAGMTDRYAMKEHGRIFGLGVEQ